MNVLTQAEPARAAIRTRTFDVVAMRMPIVYNEVCDNTDPARRYKWAIAQGLWGLLRVTEDGACR